MAKLLDDFAEEEEIAREFNRDRQTIKRWGDNYGLPFVKIGGRRLYHRPSIRDWIMERLQKPAARRAQAHRSQGRELSHGPA